MSALVVLGVLGTVFSTITLVPHVAHAMRSGVPGGSPMGWTLSFGGSTVWGVYGVVAHDLLVAAPGLVTIPCGLLLAVWSVRNHLRRAAEIPVVEAPLVEREVLEHAIVDSPLVPAASAPAAPVEPAEPIEPVEPVEPAPALEDGAAKELVAA